MSAIRFVINAAIVCWLASSGVRADTITWDGSQSGLWNDDANWDLGRVPIDGDVAVVDGALATRSVILTDDTAGIDGLTLRNGGRISTNGYLLIVDDALPAPTVIEGTDSRIFVSELTANPAGRGFDTDRLTIDDSGVLELGEETAIAEIDVEAEVGTTGTLRGRGIVRFGTIGTVNGTQVLNNDGTIAVYLSSGIVTGGKTLTLEALGGGRLDLDGDHEEGILNVDDDGPVALVVDGQLADSFSGTLTIGSGDSAEFLGPWSISGGEVYFTGGTEFISASGTLDGAAITATSTTIDVADYTRSIIKSDLNMVSGNFNTGVESSLQFDDDVTFHSSATLDLNEVTTLIIRGDTEINQSTVDLDGVGELHTTVYPGARLTLDVASIDDEADGYDGWMTVDNSTLDANVIGGWLFQGRLELNGVAAVEGTLLTVDSEGITGGVFVESGGIARISASSAFTDQALVVVPTNSFLVLNGPTTNIAGGTWTGPGTVYLDATRTTVTAPTTMNSGTVDLDGINEGGDALVIQDRLTLSVNAINSGGTNEFEGDTIWIYGPGRLVIDLPSATQEWIMAGQLRLVNSAGPHPVLSGNPVELTGTLTVSDGAADIDADVTMSAGQLTIQNGAGLVQYGDLEQTGGTLQVAAGGQFESRGELVFAPASDVVVDGVMQLEGNTTFQGGSFTGSGTILLNGDATVAADTTVGPRLWFTTGSDTTVNGTHVLAIDKVAIIDAGAAVSGTGTVRINTGASATLDAGALMNAGVENRGRLNVDSAVGTAEVLEFAQTVAGRLVVDIGGASPSEFDRLNVTTLATLGGKIDVQLVDLGGGPFIPSAGQSFLVLSAGSGFGGTQFDAEILPKIGGGLSLDIEYDTKKIIVVVVGVPGDYNLNGVVDAADYTIWRNTLGQEGAWLAADGNRDGHVSALDYDVWKTHFGEAAGSGAGARRSCLADAGVPEPGAVSSALLALAGLFAGARRNWRKTTRRQRN